MNDNPEGRAEWGKLQQEIRNVMQTMKNDVLSLIERIEWDASLLIEVLPSD